MELQTVINKIFTIDKASKVLKLKNKRNKEQSLPEIREWTETYLQETYPDANTSILEDTRDGRVGSAAVYFSLDRSFGIIAINQEGLNVISACRFATIAATCGVFSGKWMYEVQLNSKGIMQIGWCSNKCSFSADRGCGDTLNSYAYDGSRLKSWNILSYSYGERWKSGDVITNCIDLDERKIEFYRNGSHMGVAFQNVPFGAGLIYIPCVSFVDSESVCANFGARPFFYPLEGYEPLQNKPHVKVEQAETILGWIKNLTNLTVPVQTRISKCESSSDISDTKFWNRMYSIIIFHTTYILTNKYCLFNNFVPFIYGVSDGDGGTQKVYRIMDELWLYTRENVMDKMIYAVIIQLSTSFKQASDILDSTRKVTILDTLCIFLSHEKSRKYLISHYFLDRINLLPLLHHKPMDDVKMQIVIERTWWDTKGADPEVEKNKGSYFKSLQKIEKASFALEEKQTRFLRLLMINTDGTDTEASTRTIFLHKLKKFCWTEWEYSQNEFTTKLSSSVAYSGFLRLLGTMLELWKDEVPNDTLMCPTRYFYDRTFKYKKCDRIGGLEQHLYTLLKKEVVADIGQLPEIAANDDYTSLNMQLSNFASGIQEIIQIVDGDMISEDVGMPSSSGTPLLQAIFSPFLREANEDIGVGNMDNAISLISMFEALVIMYCATVAKHCKKISKAYTTYNQNIKEYNELCLTYKQLGAQHKEKDQVFQNVKTSLSLLKIELEQRSRKVGWISSILLNKNIHQRLIVFFNSVNYTMVSANCHGELFAFLPDVYLHCYGSLIQGFVKDLASAHPMNENETGIQLISEVSDLCIQMLDDTRIRHIDCKKIPINGLATIATGSFSYKLLETLDTNRCEELVQKLLQPYTDRHWKGTNWILVRFWHGDGYAFRYVEFPHHSANLINPYPVNYAMNNISPDPSKFYQNLVRQQLLNIDAQIPKLLDSMIGELHTIFGEFLTQMQELQRAIEKNEQLLLFGKLYKMCASYFNKTIALTRVLEMYIYLAPEIFLEPYYPESMSLTKRIVQIILLIVHRITSKNGCFRIVMNTRIVVLENIDYLPIEAAVMGVLIGLLGKELKCFSATNMSVPLICKMILTDASYSFENLQTLIGTPDSKNVTIMSLHDYDTQLTKTELAMAIKVLDILSFYEPMLSAVQVIPDDVLCMICCSVAVDVKFKPCDHTSCLCITSNSGLFGCTVACILSCAAQLNGYSHENYYAEYVMWRRCRAPRKSGAKSNQAPVA